MKAIFITTLCLINLSNIAHAKSFFGTVDKYIVNNTNQVIEIGSNEIEENGDAYFFDYRTGKKVNINLSEVSKSTRERIDGIKAGETILITTRTAKNNYETINRYCQVFNLFENKKAEIGCKTYREDYIEGYKFPERLDFIVKDISSAIAEVASIGEIKQGSVVKLKIETENHKSGRRVRVLVLFANGEALVQNLIAGFGDTSSIVYKGEVDRLHASDLEN